VHPRVAMQILRHSRISLTMEIYTDVPDPATREALGKLGNFLDQADEPSHAAGDDATEEPPEDAPESTESELGHRESVRFLTRTTLCAISCLIRSG
jgi:hypothetical protein